MPATSLDQVVNLAKRRGFIVQSSELYGGAAAAYDYGPLGVELKNALKRLWWREMTRRDERIVGLDAAIFMHPKVWEASGHVEAFSDPLVECKKCHKRFRADAIEKETCPSCGTKGSFTESRQFNLMFRTHLGSTEDAGSTVYLRPETAQGIYVNAPYIQQAMRLKLPFGIAQIGKAFRNEITPGHFTFRTVEFEQAEMQFFVQPKEATRWFDFWREERLRWYTKVLEFPPSTLRAHPHGLGELAHYAKAAADIQYAFPKGGFTMSERRPGEPGGPSTRSARSGSFASPARVEWQEIEGIHNRGDWDMRRHQEYSGKDLSIFEEETKEKVLPWIIEASQGVDRVLLALLAQAYTEETVAESGAAGRGKGEPRLVLKLPKALAPVQVSVFPLLPNNETLVVRATGLARTLRSDFRVQYDDAGAIGRRYRRQDEIGTPFCVTVDHQTLEDDTVTVRERDAMTQERMAEAGLAAWLHETFHTS